MKKYKERRRLKQKAAQKKARQRNLENRIRLGKMEEVAYTDQFKVFVKGYIESQSIFELYIDTPESIHNELCNVRALYKNMERLYLIGSKLRGFLTMPDVLDSIDCCEAELDCFALLLETISYHQEIGLFAANNLVWLYRSFVAFYDVPHNDSKSYINALWLAWWRKLWMLKGLQLTRAKFQLTPQLSSTLALSDIPIHASNLKMPYPFLVLALPSGFAFKDDTGTNWISGVRLGCDEGSPHSLIVAPTLSTKNLTQSLYTIPLGDHATLQEDIEAHVAEHLLTTTSTCVEPISTRFDNPLLRLFTTVVNALLYITTFPDHVEESNQNILAKLMERKKKNTPGSKKAKRAVCKLNEARKRTIFIVGNKFRIEDDRYRKAVESGRSVNVRFMVRGHWRRQVCGPGHKDRKLIFIQPFWKGPKDAVQPDRLYVVTDGRGE